MIVNFLIFTGVLFVFYVINYLKVHGLEALDRIRNTIEANLFEENHNASLRVGFPAQNDLVEIKSNNIRLTGLCSAGKYPFGSRRLDESGDHLDSKFEKSDVKEADSIQLQTMYCFGCAVGDYCPDGDNYYPCDAGIVN